MEGQHSVSAVVTRTLGLPCRHGKWSVFLSVIRFEILNEDHMLTKWNKMIIPSYRVSDALKAKQFE